MFVGSLFTARHPCRAFSDTFFHHVDVEQSFFTNRMPSARGHDIITVAVAPPTFLVTYLVTSSTDLALITTAATLFAGLMFGPDLDTDSRQYRRWGPFAFLWWPYKVVFGHRSRFSHGLVWGTVIRIVYFIVVVGLLVGAGLFVYGLLHPQAGQPLNMSALIRRSWQMLWSVDHRLLLAVFVGLWWGAATHTLADWLSTVWKSTKKIF